MPQHFTNTCLLKKFKKIFIQKNSAESRHTANTFVKNSLIPYYESQLKWVFTEFVCALTKVSKICCERAQCGRD